jgi:hypothetical protein
MCCDDGHLQSTKKHNFFTGKFLHDFREKDFLNFSQSESIIGPRRHVKLPHETKII